MSETGSIMVSLRSQENLCFVLESPKRLAMNDSISIMLIARAKGTRIFGAFPSLGIDA